MTRDEDWMRLALAEARAAADEGEVPVGAVVIRGNDLIATGRNRRESDRSPLAHAEVEAIGRASEKLRAWRLAGCTLFVTLEPCLMCIGAAIQARIDRLVFASRDPKAGAVVSLYRCAEDERLNHRIEVTEGVLADEASLMLSSFFKDLRQRKRTLPPV